jgi:hypothetical protein
LPSIATHELRQPNAPGERQEILISACDRFGNRISSKPRASGGGGGGGNGGGNGGNGGGGTISPVEIVVVSPAAGLRADAVPGEDHVAVWISSLGDGTYRAIFQPVRSGRLVIFFRSSEGAVPLGDSPYFLNVLPAAAAASACKVRAAGPLLMAC